MQLTAVFVPLTLLMSKVEQFFEAARAGDVGALKALLNEESETKLLEVTNESGWTPLFAAIHADQLDAAKWLIDQGADVDFLGSLDGNNALLLSVQEGHEEITKYLKETHPTVDLDFSRAGDGATPLFNSIQYGHESIAQFLIESGADPNKPKVTGFNPVLLAAQQGRLSLLKALVAAGGDLNYKHPVDHVTALLLAVQEGYIPIVEWCLENGAALTRKTTGLTALGTAALNNQVESFNFFFNKRGMTTMSSADRVQVLCFAARQNNPDLIELVLQEDLTTIDKTNDVGKTAFNLAVENFQPDAEKTLLIHGASPFTPLNLSRSYVAIFRYLDPRIKSNTRPPQLMKYDMRDFQKEINSGARDPFARSPLFTAARLGRVNWLEVMCDNEYDPVNLDFQDNQGWTALHEAAYAGQNESVDFLLKRGANADALNFGGRTPLDLARRNATEVNDASEMLKAGGGEASANAVSSHPELKEAFDFVGENPDYAKTIASLEKVTTGRRFAKFRSYFGFAIWTLLIGVSMPWLILSSVFGGSAAVTEILLRLNTASKLTRVSSVVGLIVALGVPLAPLIYLADDDPESGLDFLRVYPVLVAGLGFSFLAWIAVRARKEPRFRRFKNPSQSFALWPRPVAYPKQYTARKLSQLRVKAWSSTLTSYTALGVLVLEFFQQSALTFVGDNFWPEGNAVDTIFSRSLLYFGANAFLFSYLIVLIAVFVWGIFASYIGSAIYTVKSGEWVPNPGPKDKQPWLRSRFPMITQNFFESIPFSGFIVPVLTNAVFVWVVGVLFRSLDCSLDDNNVYILDETLDAATKIQCYTGFHAYMYVLSLILFFFYIPTSLLVGLFFLETSADIKFIGQFILYERTLKLLLLAIATFATNYPALTVGASIFINGFLAIACFRMTPCFDIRSVNIMRSASLAGATWSNICSGLALYLGDVENQLSYQLLIVGYLVIVLVYFGGFANAPKKFPFVEVVSDAVMKKKLWSLLTRVQANPLARRASLAGKQPATPAPPSGVKATKVVPAAPAAPPAPAAPGSPTEETPLQTNEEGGETGEALPAVPPAPSSVE